MLATTMPKMAKAPKIVTTKPTKVLQKRDYQSRIMTKTVATWVDLFNRTNEAPAVMIESPTGSGKTVMGFASLKDFIDNHSKVLGKKPEEVVVNWCAMRRELLSQAQAENDMLFGIKNVNYVSMFDSNPPECDILVFDECQHSAANSAVDVYTKSNPSLVLGLSATPYRADRQKLCFHKSIRDAGYRQLIQEGWLAKFDQYMIQDWSVETVTKTYLADPKRWGKSIAFFLTVDECNRAAEIVATAGHRTAVVTGDSPREEQLRAFENGDVDILFNVYVLSEGFDCPALKTVFCRPSGKGTTTQMCGRAFRKFGNKVAQIVQSQDTRVPFTRIATAENQYVWDAEASGWRSIVANTNVEDRITSMRQAVLKVQVVLPKLVSQYADRNTGLNYLDGEGGGRRHWGRRARR